MKKVLLVGAIVALFIAVKNIPSYAKDFASTWTLPKDDNGYLIKKENIVNNIQKITGETTSADFKITGDAAGNSYVEVYAKANNGKKFSQEEIQKILNEKYIFDIQQSNGELKLIAKRKTGMNWLNNNDNILVVFNVHVSANVATKINTTSGDAILKGLNGDQFFSATSGDFVADNIKGSVVVKTTSGDARLSNIVGASLSFDGTSGDLNVSDGQFNNIRSSTSSGDISLNNVSGNVVANSTSGDLRVILNQGSLQASTSSGDQSIEIKNPKDFIRTSASSGDVRITIPATTGANINLNGGSVSLSDKSKFSGEFSKERRAVGKWNGGGLLIDVKTSSGDIGLSFW